MRRRKVHNEVVMLLMVISVVTLLVSTGTANVFIVYLSSGNVGTITGLSLHNGSIGSAVYNSYHTEANVTLNPSTYWVMSTDSHGDLIVSLWNGTTYLLPPNGTAWTSLSNGLSSLGLSGYVTGIAASYSKNMIVELLTNGDIIYSNYNTAWSVATTLPAGIYTSLTYTTDASKNGTATPQFFAMNITGTVYSLSPTSINTWSLYIDSGISMRDMISITSNSGGNLFAINSSGYVYSSYNQLPWSLAGYTGRVHERSIAYQPYSHDGIIYIMNSGQKSILESLNGGKSFFKASPPLPSGYWVSLVNNYYMDNLPYLIAINSDGVLYVVPLTHFVAMGTDANGNIIATTNNGMTYILNSGSTAWSYLGDSLTITGASESKVGVVVGVAASYFSDGIIVEITSRGYVLQSPYSNGWTISANPIIQNGNFTSLTYTVGWSSNFTALTTQYFFAMENNGVVYASAGGNTWSLYLNPANATSMISLVSNSGGDLLSLNSSGGLFRSYSNQNSGVLGAQTQWKYAGATGFNNEVSISYLYGSGDSTYNILPATGGGKAIATYDGGASSDQFGNSLPPGSYVAIVNSTSIYSGAGTSHHLAILEPNGTIYVYTHYRWSFLTSGAVISSPSVWNNTVYVGSNDNDLYALNSTTGSLLWEFQTGAAIKDKPLIYNGNVYFGSNDFYAVNGSTGALLWQYANPKPPPPPPPPPANTVSSAVQYDGIIYFGDTNNVLYAMNATTGNYVWSFNAGRGSFTTSAIVGMVAINGVETAVIYIGSSNDNMYALNALTGLQLPGWPYKAKSSITTDALLYKGILYFGTNNGNIHAVNAVTGVEAIVKYNLGGAVHSSPVEFSNNILTGSNAPGYYSLTVNLAQNWVYTPGNNIYSTGYPTRTDTYFGSDDHNLYAVNTTTGLINWSFTTYGNVRSSPWYENQWIYFGSNDFNVYALNTNARWEKRSSVPSLPSPSGSPPTALVWKYTTANSVYSSPVIAYGDLFVGSTDNSVYALNALTGAKIWSYATGGAIYSTPAVSNGIVYIGSNDNYLYALNATTGAFLWSFNTNGQVRSSPAVAYGIVYVGSASGFIYALNALTGAVIWNYNTKNPVYSSPMVYNGIVYIGSNSHLIYAFNATVPSPPPPPKNPLWEYNAYANIYTKPFYYNGSIYVSTNRNGGNVVVLNSTYGTYEWSVSINPAGAGGNQYSSPVVYGNNLYIGSQDSNLYVINTTTRTIEWSYGTGNAIDSTPLIYDGNVYFGSMDNSIYAVNISREGSVWGYGTNNGIFGSAAEYDNIIYTGSTDNSVYALKSGALPNAPPLDNGAYGYFLKVSNTQIGSYSINLMLLSVTNISLIQYLVISINDSSNQIVIQNGNIIQNAGPLYTLYANSYDTLYISTLLSPGYATLYFLVMFRDKGVIVDEMVILNIK